MKEYGITPVISAKPLILEHLFKLMNEGHMLCLSMKQMLIFYTLSGVMFGWGFGYITGNIISSWCNDTTQYGSAWSTPAFGVNIRKVDDEFRISFTVADEQGRNERNVHSYTYNLEQITEFLSTAICIERVMTSLKTFTEYQHVYTDDGAVTTTEKDI